MKKLRELLVIGVMVLSVISMSGIVIVPNVQAAASAGDLIKMDGLSAVYYLSDNGKRYVFPNSTTYFSWYSDFSGVVTIPAAELQSYPIGGNIVMRPGTKMIKITTDPSVYAVEPNGVLRKIQSEAQASALYGTNWNKRIVDVADSYFVNYTMGTALADGQIPAGSLVKNANNATVYYYDGTNYRSVASEAALRANGLSLANVLTVTNTLTAGGSAITGMESSIVKTSQGTSGGTVVTGSGLMVSLNSGSAASTSIVNGQALADLASFNFTAANDGPVTVKTLKLKRIGISADANLEHVYLFEGTKKLTDAGNFSNGYVSFSKGDGLIVVPAGQTKTITVKADVATSVSGGNIGVAINAASDVISTGASTTGSFPLNGNLMSMTTATGISTVVLTANTATTTTMKAGNTNAIVWSSQAVVSNKAVDFKHLALKQIGSINSDDLANLSLFVDGTKVATAALVDNTVNFDFTAVKLNTGNHTIEVKADIVKGSSRNFSFSMQEAANAVFTDTNYNINVAATGTALTSAPSFTISTGTLSLSADTTFNATEVVKTATNATISRFKLKAFGEDVKVNTLSVNLVSTGTTTANETINDFAIYVDGTQVGSSQTVTFGTSSAATSSKTFGTTNLFTVAAGKEVVVEIKGSMNLDSATQLKTVKANITGLTAQGVVSYATVSTVSANANNTLNVVSGSLNVAKNSSMQDQNVSKNTQKVKIGSFILSAGSAEGVNVSNVRITFNASTTASIDNMSNIYISDNQTPINPSANNDFNVNFNVAKSGSKVIDVFADLGDVTDGQKIQTTATITYRTDVTQTFGTSNGTIGQTLTVATAALGTISNVSDSPVSGFVIGGTDNVTAAKLKFVASNGNAYINELVFDVTASNSVDAISQITVEGVTAPVVGGTATLTGLNKEIVSGLQGTQVEVKANYNPVTSAGNGGIATGNTAYLTLKSVKYTVNGAQSTVAANVQSNTMKVVSAYPTVVDAKDYGTNPNLVPSNKSEVMRFKVANTGSNPVNLKQVSFTPYFDYTITGTKTVMIYDVNDLNTNLATSTAVYTNSGTAADVVFNNDVTVSGERTFVVYVGNLGTASTTGNFFQLSMVNSGWLWNDSTITGTIDGTYLKEFQGATFKK